MQTITSKELIDGNDKSLLVLDIRGEDKYNEWHIKGSENIDVYNDIWGGNFDAVKHKLSRLPKDKKIVTVCNAGVTSQNASMLLESMGYQTLILEGGMKGWNALHKSANVIDSGDLLLTQIIRVGKGCLSYLIGSKISKECLIVDPSQFVEEYAQTAKDLGFKINGVIETHVHADHLSGARQLAELTKTKHHIWEKNGGGTRDFLDFRVGENRIKVIETPGHTNGSVCLLINNGSLLTGDTLFLEGVGRPDLGRSKEEIEKGAKALFASLEKIKNLDKETIILPAHFSSYEKFPISEKLGILLDSNAALKMDSEQEFVNHIIKNMPMAPPNYEQIKGINKSHMRLPRQMGEQLEFGPNRCAAK